MVNLSDGTSILKLNRRKYGLHAIGPSDGKPVFHNHGGPSSRLEVELFRSTAEDLGLRIIGIDRPGIGLSDPVETRSFSGFAHDVSALADIIGLEKFAVSGWSEGGPWALGCAHYIDHNRLVMTASIAGGSYGAFGDNWCAPFQDKVDRLGGFLAMHLTPAFTLMYDMLGWDAVKHPENYWHQLMSALSKSDQELCSQPEIKSLFLRTSAECFRPGAHGLVADALALYHRWEFDVRQTQGAVQFWQGDEDQLITPEINWRIAKVMPHAQWNSVPGIGHFVAVKKAKEIFGSLKNAF
jgi:pimeloyl-ACP methyl ester carboxylesterase